MRRLRLPSPAMIVALIALVAALTPAADAFHNAVQQALFAKKAQDANNAKRARVAKYASNAGRVNGIRASKKPEPGQLFPLTRSGLHLFRTMPKIVQRLAENPPRDGAQGPQGPQGPEGPQGPAGPAGPSQGFGAGTDTPPAGATVLATASATTTAAGALKVDWYSEIDYTCAGSGCQLFYGLYVNGTPVEGSERSGIDTSQMTFPPESIHTFGLSEDLPPGTHTIQLVATGIDADVESLEVTSSQFGAVLVGSRGASSVGGI